MSRQPRKQRKAWFQAPLHQRQAYVHAHLSKELRSQRKKRALPVRKGDTVKVVRGKFRGRSGKVTLVNLKNTFVSVEGMMLKKQSGKEVFAKIHPSNVIITQLSERKGD